MKVIISGGGTGGHIFPALSIANAIKRRRPDAEILFVGADNRMEMERVPAAGYDIIGLPVSGFDRKNMFKNVRVLMRLWQSMRKARRIVRDFKPDIAIGVGGYASGPTLKAAQRAGIPTLIQEQNSYAGVTNKLLAKKATAICTAYPDMERFFPADKIELTGNPVRKALFECTLSQAEAKEKLGFDPSRPLVLAVGGSLGARTINRAIASGIENAIRQDIQILWQTGKRAEDYAAEVLKGTTAPGIKAATFISDMDVAYRAADLVVSRAGAGTISELQLLGKAAILVPSPNVAEDHQRMNAEALASRDAAVMILDSDAGDKLIATVCDIIAAPDRLDTLRKNISLMALRDADEHIVDRIMSIIQSKK